MLSKMQFDVLIYIHENKKGKLTQTMIAEGLEISVGSANKTVNELKKAGLISNVNRSVCVTEKGYELLEEYRVKRAVILAAGFGAKMMPLSLYAPTPLIIAKGKRIIETLLDALIDKEINEIYIVAGFLSEQFNVLKEKYPMIKIIENKDYKETLSVASCYCAKEYLENAYVLHSDLYVQNHAIIRRYEYEPNYLGMFVDKTDDWRYYLSKGQIVGLKQGGTNCFLMYGVMYLDKHAGNLLRELLIREYDAPGFKSHMLEYIILNSYNKEIPFSVRKCKEGDLFEFDSYAELAEFDALYRQ